jgi:hypothetical protein
MVNSAKNCNKRQKNIKNVISNSRSRTIIVAKKLALTLSIAQNPCGFDGCMMQSHTICVTLPVTAA